MKREEFKNVIVLVFFLAVFPEFICSYVLSRTDKLLAFNSDRYYDNIILLNSIGVRKYCQKP